jgi:hypothetical protein
VNRVECAISIVSAKPTLVGPPVANVDQFAHEGAVTLVEHPAEHITPLISEDSQKELCIRRVGSLAPSDELDPVGTVLRLAFPFDERLKASAQEPEPLPHTFVITGSHR